MKNKIIIWACLMFFLIIFVQGSGSFNPVDDRSIGYEYLNSSGDVVSYLDADTVHIWNNATISDYFFDINSGIQLTNHFEDYWTKNIFCIGYYNNNEWHKIACADELSNFNKMIDSDDKTYVNITMWKDIEYNGYDLRLGINYYLELNDETLSITVYGKNIGGDIPYDLGFAWKITDIDIPHKMVGPDTIFINNTDYNLDGVYNLLFQNMTKMITPFNETTQEDDIIITPISKLRLFDWTEFLTLDWDNNLNYAVKMVGNGIQSEFQVSILINAGKFNEGQEKSTTFQWIDAEGDYTGEHFDTAGSGNAAPNGISNDGTYFSIVDNSDDLIYKYWMNGTYISNWDCTDNNYPYGITQNDTYFWVTDGPPISGDGETSKYWLNGSYTGESIARPEDNYNNYGVTTDDNYIWISNYDNKKVYKHLMNGTITSENFSVAAGQSFPKGITNDGTYMWIVNSTAKVYKYWLNGTYISNWDLTSANGAPRSISYHDGYFWVTDSSTDEVYKYVSSEDPPEMFKVIEDIYLYDGTGASVTLIKFNMSAIPAGSTITAASLNIYLNGDYNPSSGDLNIYRIANQSWSEANSASVLNSTWLDYNTNLDNTQNITTDIEWKILNVTTQVKNEWTASNYNITIGIEDQAYIYQGTGGLTSFGATDTISIGEQAGPSSHLFYFRAKENTITATKSYLNITYTEGAADTCSCPGVATNWEIDMTDNCQITAACNISTGVLNFTGDHGFVNISSKVIANKTMGGPPANTTLWLFGADAYLSLKW